MTITSGPTYTPAGPSPVTAGVAATIRGVWTTSGAGYGVLQFIEAWRAATAYVASGIAQAYRMPTVYNGHSYECTTSGTSHATTEPTWPTTNGNTVSDGTCVWTCRALAYAWTRSDGVIGTAHDVTLDFTDGIEDGHTYHLDAVDVSGDVSAGALSIDIIESVAVMESRAGFIHGGVFSGGIIRVVTVTNNTVTIVSDAPAA